MYNRLFAQNQQKNTVYIYVYLYVHLEPNVNPTWARVTISEFAWYRMYTFGVLPWLQFAPPRRQQGNLFYYFPEANDRCGDDGCVLMCSWLAALECRSFSPVVFPTGKLNLVQKSGLDALNNFPQIQQR